MCFGSVYLLHRFCLFLPLFWVIVCFFCHSAWGIPLESFCSWNIFSFFFKVCFSLEEFFLIIVFFLKSLFFPIFLVSSSWSLVIHFHSLCFYLQASSHGAFSLLPFIIFFYIFTIYFFISTVNCLIWLPQFLWFLPHQSIFLSSFLKFFYQHSNW